MSRQSEVIEKMNEAISLLEQLVYYSQIHTVKGVVAAGFDTHDDAWRKSQKFIHDNCNVVNGKYVFSRNKSKSNTS